MSNRECFVRSPETEVHDKVLDNNPDRIGIWKFSEQGREPTTNSTHMTPGPGIEPRRHRWEASALTTGPSLLPACTT